MELEWFRARRGAGPVSDRDRAGTDGWTSGSFKRAGRPQAQSLRVQSVWPCDAGDPLAWTCVRCAPSGAGSRLGMSLLASACHLSRSWSVVYSYDRGQTLERKTRLKRRVPRGAKEDRRIGRGIRRWPKPHRRFEGCTEYRSGRFRGGQGKQWEKSWDMLALVRQA
nr:hypothetical protein CFP56_08990 [Quercus suber]POF02605.1 hypothetical protein CFP56_58237 [Quercus suber]